MKSLGKEELQKNEGDLPEELSSWLQQQTTAMKIECMEGLDKLACLRKEQLHSKRNSFSITPLCPHRRKDRKEAVGALSPETRRRATAPAAHGARPPTSS
jgi:hypothetical protein